MKEKGFLMLLGGLVASFLSPVLVIVGALFLACMVDFVSGVWKAKHKKENLSILYGTLTTVKKFGLYFLIILVIHGADRAAINDIIKLMFGKQEIMHIFTKVASLILFAIEFRSINNNYREVKGVSMLSAINEIIGKAKKVSREVGEIKKGATTVLILLIGVGLSGCGSGQELYDAAVKKGVKCEPIKEIVKTVVYDTIIDQKTNTIHLIERQVKIDTVYRENIVKIPMSKQERKAYKDSLEFEREKLEAALDMFDKEIRLAKIERRESKDNNEVRLAEIKNEEPGFIEKIEAGFKYFFYFILLIIVLFAGFKIYSGLKKND